MKEIGGFFGLEQFSGKEYHENAIGVNSGRNALLYIVKARQYRKVYIPRFLCDSVSRLCDREGIVYEEYSIDDALLPIFDRVLSADEALYIVNFYGQITNEQIVQMKARWGNVILDNVQAFFQKPVAGIDTIYSCRKFFGVPDGGYAATDATLPSPLPQDMSQGRVKHLLGRLEESAALYYADFQTNDELFYDLPLMKMSLLTRTILCGIDYDWVRRRRNDNYAFLSEQLGTKNLLRPVAPDGPYCYPFYIQNGMELKKRLASKNIYVATLWPNVLAYENTLEKNLAENVLPLPCDQRYTLEDMLRIVECVNDSCGG